jgi:hypothetical protein
MQMRDVTPASEEAERVLQAVLNDTFYIFPYLERVDDNVRYRFDNIINRTNPEPRPMR